MLRKEISGLHYYDKETGVHILCDEVNTPVEQARKTGPRQLSLMLTSMCNCDCDFCYIKKSNNNIESSLLLNVLDVAKELEVLDVTLGGGEPTMYEKLIDLIHFAWECYPFGLSITTNGIDVDKLLEVPHELSTVRISFDNYKRRLDKGRANNILKLNECHKVCANILLSPGSLEWAKNIIKELDHLGVIDYLIIPLHENGEYVVNEWNKINEFLDEYCRLYNIMVTGDASEYITLPLLENYGEKEYLFAHIDAFGNIKERSWGNSMAHGNTKEELKKGLLALNPLNRGGDLGNENMARNFR